MKIAVVDDERPARKELISQILDVKPDCIVKGSRQWRERFRTI